MDQPQIKSIDLITPDTPFTTTHLQERFTNFIRTFKINNTYPYNSLLKDHLVIQLNHIASFDQSLYDELIARPKAVVKAFSQVAPVELISTESFASLRELNTFNRIVRVRGIVVSCSTVYAKPLIICVSCKNCMETRMVEDLIPRSCKSECGVDPFVTVPEKSELVDCQTIKIQEDFNEVPVGEMPRHVSILLERQMVNITSPGSQIVVTGILEVSNGRQAKPYIRALGLETERKGGTICFTEEEEMKFRAMSENIYEKIVKSIAPAIHGMDDVKKAVACLLFGGARRQKGGLTLRGSINVLLLGDPGMAKSQLLKFVERVAPIGVYTSGKGSSAAGLTASVVKDSHGQFYLEGGALVLADGGVCCIDEFDKMDETDRVAIHEAMEQQTISIAKAGITTMLNTRTAVLAAANPAFGRYDDYRSPAENIEFGSTILSRFDCIFILKDEVNQMGDLRMARHVLDIHSHAEAEQPPIDMQTMRRYIEYAQRVQPVLSEESKTLLKRFYVDARQRVRRLDEQGIPITVRQLEAIARISESLARMELLDEVSPVHVREAIRLFRVSTMSAVNRGYYLEGMVRSDVFKNINLVVDQILSMVPVGMACRMDKLVGLGEPDVVDKAVCMMVKQGRLVVRDGGSVVVRIS